MLSAYLDGELTQADQQRVRIWLEDSAEAREHYDELKRIKELTQSMSFAPPPDDRIDELERALSVQTPRSIGWVLLTLGLLIGATTAAAFFFLDPAKSAFTKSIVGMVGGGVVFLFGSVARQRWLEIPHDRYREVKR